MSILLFAGLALVLFLASFVTGRRYGVLGLSLAAGYVLSSHWASTLTPFIESQGVVVVSPPLATVVAMALILAPPAVLLFGGPSNNTALQKWLGSIMFTLLGLAFLAESLSSALYLEGPGFALHSLLLEYQSVIVFIGLVLAVVDILMTRSSHRRKH